MSCCLRRCSIRSGICAAECPWRPRDWQSRLPGPDGGLSAVDPRDPYRAAIVALSLSPEGLLQAEAARVFRLCDVTADGKLDLDELVNMTGFSKMARNLMGKADVDKSGQLDEEEWVEYIVSLGATKVLLG